MTTITTQSLAGKGLTIRYGWVTKDHKIWADGHTVTTTKTEFELAVEIEGIGEIIAPRLGTGQGGAKAILGSVIYQGKHHPVETHIAVDVYEAICNERDKNDKPVSRTTHPGVCPKCGSHCYGDCMAN